MKNLSLALPGRCDFSRRTDNQRESRWLSASAKSPGWPVPCRGKRMDAVLVCAQVAQRELIGSGAQPYRESAEVWSYTAGLARGTIPVPVMESLAQRMLATRPGEAGSELRRDAGVAVDLWPGRPRACRSRAPRSSTAGERRQLGPGKLVEVGMSRRRTRRARWLLTGPKPAHRAASTPPGRGVCVRVYVCWASRLDSAGAVSGNRLAGCRGHSSRCRPRPLLGNLHLGPGIRDALFGEGRSRESSPSEASGRDWSLHRDDNRARE